MSTLEDARKNRNKELVERMRAGERLSNFSAQLSWFPPRPQIKKDENLISKLYGEKSCTSSQFTEIATLSGSEK